MGHIMHCSCGARATASICEKYGGIENCEYFCAACYWQVRRARSGRPPANVEKAKKRKARMV